MSYKFVYILNFVLISWNNLEARRIQDSINVYLEANFFCFRILNGTHQAGCQSPLKGVHGVVQLVSSADDFDYISKDPDHRSPFVAALFLKSFRDLKLVNRLAKSKNVAGLLVLHTEHDGKAKLPLDFSEDATCPNSAVASLYGPSSKYHQCKSGPIWNPKATLLRLVDWGIPVFYIYNRTEINFIVKFCYDKSNKGANKSWPLCAAELSSFFMAAQNSETCIRRNNLFAGLHSGDSNCDPVADVNVYTFVPHTNKSQPLKPRSVFVLAARMDSFSLFNHLAPGHFSSIAGVVIMLALAEALGRLVPFDGEKGPEADRRLLLALFNGESLDYIGSSRMVWDIGHGRFPEMLDAKTVNQSALFDLRHIEAMIEISQPVDLSSPLSEKQPLYAYVDPDAYQSDKFVRSKVDSLTKLLTESLGNRSLTFYPKTALPASSLHSFLRVNRSIPAMLLTSYPETGFTNKFYNSFMDSARNSEMDKNQSLKTLSNNLATTAEGLLRFLNRHLFADKNSSVQIDRQLAERLTECFFQWPLWNCTIFRRILEIGSIITSKDKMRSSDSKPDENIKPVPASAYTSVNVSLVRNFVDNLLPLFFGYRVPWDGKMPSECTNAGYGQGGTYDKQDPVTRDGILSYTYAQDFLQEGSGGSFKPFCLISPVRKSPARSPAFIIENYDLSLPDSVRTFTLPPDYKSGDLDKLAYSTWAESSWDKIWLKLFLQPDPNWERAIFVVGLLWMAFCLFVGYAISRTTGLLFAGQTETVSAL